MVGGGNMSDVLEAVLVSHHQDTDLHTLLDELLLSGDTHTNSPRSNQSINQPISS